jgi:dTDP-4-dehydrorhamnose reductase
MKVLLIGANGQVGQELVVLLSKDSRHLLVPLTRKELDVTSQAQVERVINQYHPDVVVNTAAYTQVDPAEKEPEAAHAINASGPEYLAKACQALNIPLIHFSTDYVFDGSQDHPYLETDTPNPQGQYGRSKLRGEQLVQEHCTKHIIIRTTWVFGRYGKNFINIMLNLMAERETVSVVSDQMACPTAGRDIANMLVSVIDQLTPDFIQWGIYHYAGTPAVSRFEFAQAIMPIAQKRGGKIQQILPVLTSAFPTPAKRPLYSVLDQTKIKQVFGLDSSDWKRALREEF